MDGSRERDQSVERLLRQSPQTRRNAGVTDSCLDAETLAAWVDGGLSGAELALAQTHVADCARCQTMIGTLARINSSVPLAKPEHTSRRWLAWFVPLTAAAAAVALWVAVPRDTGAPLARVTEVRKSADASNAQEPSSPADRLQATGSQKKEQESSQRQARRKDERPPPAVNPADSAKNDAAGRDQPPPEERELLKDARRLEADSLRPNASGEAARSVSAPVPSAPAAAAAQSPLNETVSVAAALPAQRAAKAAGFEIVSPDRSVRWRIDGAVVQRSTNEGSSWQAVSTGIAAVLTSGAAPSASVCWIVGRGGVVLLSTDGTSWRRVAFPEAADLATVQAVNALTASVTTADGRIFTTTDGGVTWARR